MRAKNSRMAVGYTMKTAIFCSRYRDIPISCSLMDIRLLTSAKDLAMYDQWVKSHPQGNLWQSVEWKTYQEKLGREVRVYAAMSGERLAISALVVIDKTVGGLSTWDCPRGPLVQNSEFRIQNFFETVVSDAKKNKCLSFYFSPLENVILNSQFSILNSPRHEQPDATRILDLTLNDDQLLAQMHQKGRYNINVARKNGVTVEQSTDIDAYYALAQKTGKRDAFGIPSKLQLRAFLDHVPGSFLLLAYQATSHQPLATSNKPETGGRWPVAGLIGVTWPPSAKASEGKNSTGIYYYGASDYEHRSLMAPYLLQWEAIQLCKKAGCTRYDLLGIAPPESPANHPWAGISSFKEKFGGTVISYPPEQEITLRPMVKQLLSLKRKIIG